MKEKRNLAPVRIVKRDMLIYTTLYFILIHTVYYIVLVLMYKYYYALLYTSILISRNVK